jgi:Ca-activated chloride channel family protein
MSTLKMSPLARLRIVEHRTPGSRRGLQESRRYAALELYVGIGLLLVLVLTSSSFAQIGGQAGRGAVGARGLNQPEPVTISVQPPPVTDLDTVLLTVSVTGPGNNAVAGIARNRFQVLEDGVEQKVTYFWEDSRPLTVGFIFDDSQRMGVNDKVYVLKEAGQSFMKTKQPADEFFVVRMSDLADVVVNFTTNVRDFPLNYAAIGETALYDAIYVGLAVIKEAANPRKFLVVITSGGDRCTFNDLIAASTTCSDSSKKTTEQMLKEFALRQPVQIYSLFMVDTIEDNVSEMVHRDANVLNDLAMMTGGRMYNAPNSARGVEALMAELARGLTTQYIVGYKSTREARDGKRRGVKVRVNSPEGSPKLDVWTKAGYYAPKDR